MLQVAIFALNRIAQIQQVATKSKIHFILRDQVTQGTAQMEKAFETLRVSLRKAASAAGAQLDQLLDIPQRAEEIITMFPSALSLEQVNGNPKFV